MEIRKLNIKHWLPNLHQNVYLRNQQVVVVNPSYEADIEATLAYIINNRGNQTISMAIDNAYIVTTDARGNLHLPECYRGVDYYVTQGRADKYALIYFAMKAAHYENSGCYLHSLENKLLLHNIYEIKETII